MLPSEVEYGYVRTRVLLAVADSDDEDRLPDGAPAKGTVTFTPRETVTRGGDEPFFVVKTKISAQIAGGPGRNFEAGDLIHNGHPGVWLLAGRYAVTFEIAGAGIPSFDIEVGSEHTEESPLWLSQHMPLTPTPSVKFVVNEQIYQDTLEAAETARSNAITRISGAGENLRIEWKGGEDVLLPLPKSVPDGTGFTVSPMTFGAVGDGETDDTAALQAAVDAATVAGETLLIDCPHRIGSTIYIDAGAQIEASAGGAIRFSHNDPAFRIRGDDVSIRGLLFEGSYSGANDLGRQRGIDARPPVDDGTERLKNVTIDGVTMRRIGVAGVRIRWGDGFRIIDSTFDGWGQSAVTLANARGGNVSRNHIYHDGTNPFGSTYGINISSGESDWSASENPGSKWVDIDGNFVFNTPRSGISNHGCDAVRVRGNTLRRCYTGISGVIVSPEIPVPVTGMIVSNNTIDGETLNSRGAGVLLTGSGDHSGTIVLGNSVLRHGASATRGGITLADVPGAVVSSNSVRECQGNGISATRSDGSVVTGNLVIDAWAYAGDPAAFFIEAETPGGSVTMSGNAVIRGALAVQSPVSSVNAFGVGGTGVVREFGNDWRGASASYGASVRHESVIGHSVTSQLGFYGAQPLARRPVVGSRDGNAALADLLRWLGSLGLVVDETTP